MRNYECEKRTFNIALVCDFFYPNVGGVESHIYQLGIHLVQIGHRVIVITHQYRNGNKIRSGVRYLKGVLREIFIRESIEIVHGHSAFSPLTLEALLDASTMGLKTVFTDHSLFGFADLSSILANKALEFGLTNVLNCICVSHTSKENTVIRANFNPHRVFVIPNAIDSSVFYPDVTKTKPDTINIVVISRLVYRKGTDLLCLIIPILCLTFPYLEFTIGGDGPKYLNIEEIRERYKLHNRVHLIGSVPQEKVRDVLITGDLFLNTSLTEAFCIAILEAASCGLKVVSTKVGGIVEVLPDDMIELAPVSASELASKLASVIESTMKEKTEISLEKRIQIAQKRHEKIKTFYNWNDVAKRTELVYNTSVNSKRLELWPRLRMYMDKLGFVFGKIMLGELSKHLNFTERIYELRRLRGYDSSVMIKWPDQSTFFITGISVILVLSNLLFLLKFLKGFFDGNPLKSAGSKSLNQKEEDDERENSTIKINLNDCSIEFPRSSNEIYYRINEGNIELNVEFLRSMFAFLSRSWPERDIVRREVMSFEFDIN